MRFSRLGGIDFFKRGKVREIYDLKDKFLMVATDRISCFDVVLPTEIPGKGEVLTKLSVLWFEFTKDIIPNHFITANFDEFPQELQKYIEGMTGKDVAEKLKRWNRQRLYIKIGY